jgi:hypothetical protein
LYPETVEVLAVQLSATECAAGCTPVPDSVTLAGEPLALLTIETLPVTLPAADGLNCTVIVVRCEGERVTGVLAPLKVNPEPLMLICEMVTFELPVSVMVTVCEAELPLFTLPKLKLDELSESVRAEATPVPLKTTAVGEFGALLTRERVPATVPADCGENCTLNVVDVPGLMERGKVTVPVLNPLPITLNCVTVNTAVPVLLN